MLLRKCCSCVAREMVPLATRNGLPFCFHHPRYSAIAGAGGATPSSVPIITYSSLTGWAHPLVDRSCHSIVREVAPPCTFIFTALVTMGGPPVPEESILRKCQVGTESFFKPTHPLLVDSPTPIIRSHQRFQWANDVPPPLPLWLLAAAPQEPPYYWG